MSDEIFNKSGLVSWDEIGKFEESVTSEKGEITEENLIKIFRLVDRLDESTLPGKLPPGFSGDEEK